MENLKERIEKKLQQIAKMEKNLKKYVVGDEFTAICDRFFQTKDSTELKAYKAAHNLMWLPEYYSKRYDLEDAKATLAKYYKMQEAEDNRNTTLNAIPEVIKSFRDTLIARWDEYDEWRKAEISKDMKTEPDYRDREAYKEYKNMMHQKWGWNYFEIARRTAEEDHKSNVKDADTLVLNLINRTIELCGTITDAQYLRLSRDNNGYAIINGRIIGTKGTVRIESIGAGGYNIQRYHIRVLVKPVKK